LWEAPLEHRADLAHLAAGGDVIGLREGRAYQGCDHSVGVLGYLLGQVAQEVHPAAPLAGARQDLGQGPARALTGVRGQQLQAPRARQTRSRRNSAQNA